MNVIERFRSDVENGPRGLISEIATETGVALKTLRNLRYGETKEMRYHHMRLLEDYYAKKGKRDGKRSEAVA